jgi:fatty-acid desaturase
MQLVPGSERIYADEDSNPVEGRVQWAPAKSLWIGVMTLVAVLLGPVFFTWSALALSAVVGALTLCFGHSVGMHRRLIHGSFACPLWLEHVCVYLGTLVGMAGPIGMIRMHDYRDWAQRQTECHDYFGHRKGFWQDAWWQMHCNISLLRPPKFRLESRLESDVFYEFLERTWMWQQLPWSIAFFMLGGPSWVVWGICARVAVCVTGHWLIGHYAHRDGGQSWIVEQAAVQGYNVRVAGLISMGESWHNNHHAFPGSAKLGLLPGEIDLGWELIRAFEAVGFATDIKTPDMLPHRHALRRLAIKEKSRPAGGKVPLAAS